MFFKKSPQVWPMTQKHLDQVIKLIADHDEDDAEAAETTYKRFGFDGQFVMALGKEVIGVSGSREADNTEGCHWLSWSYMRRDMQGQGLGVELVRGVIQKLYANKARKLFVASSDYTDEEGNDVYARARSFYEEMGFKHELTLPDYYDDGESRIISAIDFEQSQEAKAPSWSSSAGFIGSDIFELLESDDVYGISWELVESGSNSAPEELQKLLEKAKEQDAHRIYVGLPADAIQIINNLEQSGFEKIGELKDYYQHGIDEVNLKKEL